MTRAAVYARVSTAEQAQQDKASLPVQRERCEAYCQSQGWDVAEIYTDGGISGAQADRPALTRLMADARAGKFERAVFYRLDRFGRNTRDLQNLAHELKRYGVGIASVMDNFDTESASGRLFFSLLSAVAEFERDQIGQRTKMGKIKAAQDGLWNTGCTPFGFNYDKKSRHLVINESEAAVVVRIYRLYTEEGLSQRKIKDLLTSEGVPTKTKIAMAKDGKKGWHATHLARMLTNPIYMGSAYYNKSYREAKAASNGNGDKKVKKLRDKSEWIKIPCPAIVSEEIWTRAQERAKINQRYSRLCPKDKETDFLLSGLIRCQVCGRPIYGHTVVGRWRYYYCSGQHRGYGQCRDPKHVPADRIEADVLRIITETFSQPERVLQAIQSAGQQLRAAEDEQEGLISTLRRNLEAATEERERYEIMWAQGLIGDAKRDKHLTRIDKTITDWTVDLDRLHHTADQKVAVQEIEDSVFIIASKTQTNLEAMTIQERKELVRRLIERVWLDADNRIHIECVVPGILSGDGVHTQPVMR
jgi:site-specific DNA recombinase